MGQTVKEERAANTKQVACKMPSILVLFCFVFKSADSTESAFMIQTAKEIPLTRRMIKVEAIQNRQGLGLKATLG